MTETRPPFQKRCVSLALALTVLVASLALLGSGRGAGGTFVVVEISDGTRNISHTDAALIEVPYWFDKKVELGAEVSPGESLRVDRSDIIVRLVGPGQETHEVTCSKGRCPARHRAGPGNCWQRSGKVYYGISRQTAETFRCLVGAEQVPLGVAGTRFSAEVLEGGLEVVVADGTVEIGEAGSPGFRSVSEGHRLLRSGGEEEVVPVKREDPQRRDVAPEPEPLLAAHGPARFRSLVPADVPIHSRPPATESAFLRASADVDGDVFGLKIEMEVSRGGSDFRTVPLSTPVCEGDFLAFRFTPSAAGHATVVTHGTSGAWSRIWPARDWEDPSFGPSRPARWPTDEGRGFPLTGPPGEELVLVFFSPVPFSSEVRRLQEQLLLGIEVGGPSAMTGGGSRLTSITYLSDSGHEQAGYQVGQGEQAVAFTLDHRETCRPLE